MTSVALFGAGGKMGYRLASNLKGSRYQVRHVELAQPGRERLKSGLGIDCVSSDEALAGAEIVILAVPDTMIRQISGQLSPSLKPGTMVMVLDAAAPFAGHLPKRDDLVYYVTHPCHPSIFFDSPDEAARKDRFGGVAAKQSIVNSLMQGPESAYAVGEELARTIWRPILRSHRVTVDQMALLEPALSETLCASLLAVMREGMEEVVARGVPREAARDFLLGHMNILASVIFEEIQGRFSDAANKAIEFGKPALMRADWKRIFEHDEVAASIRRIT
jgi:D-apionate oxidoisomerase